MLVTRAIRGLDILFRVLQLVRDGNSELLRGGSVGVSFRKAPGTRRGSAADQEAFRWLTSFFRISCRASEISYRARHFKIVDVFRVSPRRWRRSTRRMREGSCRISISHPKYLPISVTISTTECSLPRETL